MLAVLAAAAAAAVSAAASTTLVNGLWVHLTNFAAGGQCSDWGNLFLFVFVKQQHEILKGRY